MATSLNAGTLASLEFAPATHHPDDDESGTPAPQGNHDPHASRTGSVVDDDERDHPQVVEDGDKTPPPSPSRATGAAGTFTPMRRGRVHGLDDSPRDKRTESARRARAQEDMEEKGRIVERMREGRFKAPSGTKQLAGGDAVRESGIPVWRRTPSMTGTDRLSNARLDPFERAQLESARMRAAEPTHSFVHSGAPPTPGRLAPLTMGPPQSARAKGKARDTQGRMSPPPVPGSSTTTNRTHPEAWQPLTQYLPHQRAAYDALEDYHFPPLASRPATVPRAQAAARPSAQGQRAASAHAASPGAGASTGPTRPRDEDEAERLNEAAARRIQDQLWAEERDYNRSRRSQSQPDDDDPMEEDVFADDDDDVEILAPDSAGEGDEDQEPDSFDELSDIESPDDDDSGPGLLNIEPATGDDKAKAAARASIFAETKARIRWSQPTHEPLAGMTQTKLVAGIDPEQLRQHLNAASCLDNVFIGFVHAVGGTKSADIDRVTLVTALDTMIQLTCKTGTSVLFSAARQDKDGPRLRPGTVLIDVANDDLKALWQESAHWAQAGVRITVQKYHQAHSAFMVTLEGTRRNKTAVIHGVRAAAKKLPELKNVFRQYNSMHPGKGRAARDNLVKSITARPLVLTSRKALGFGTVQYNIYARLHERDTDAAPCLLTGDDEVDGYPALTTEQRWAIRDAFQNIAIIDGRLGDATPIPEPWDCGLCYAESHPVGKCDLKKIKGWFKSYEEFLAANKPAAKGAPAGGQDRKGKGKAAPPKGGRPGGQHNAGSSRPGPSKWAPPRRGN